MRFTSVALPLVVILYAAFAATVLRNKAKPNSLSKPMVYAGWAAGIVVCIVVIYILSLLFRAAPALRLQPNLHARFRITTALYLLILTSMLANISLVATKVLDKTPKWTQWALILLPAPLLLILVSRVFVRMYDRPSAAGAYAAVRQEDYDEESGDWVGYDDEALTDTSESVW